MGKEESLRFDAHATEVELRFDLPIVVVNEQQAKLYVERYDVAHHTAGAIIDGEFVSGLYVFALVNQEMLRHPLFAGSVVGLEIEIAFLRPVRPGARLVTSGWTTRRPSVSRPGCLVSRTRAVVESDGERSMKYRVIHLLKQVA